MGEKEKMVKLIYYFVNVSFVCCKILFWFFCVGILLFMFMFDLKCEK